MLLSVGFFAKRQPPEEELRLLENKQTKKNRGEQSFGMPTRMVVWVETTQEAEAKCWYAHAWYLKVKGGKKWTVAVTRRQGTVQLGEATR